MDLLEWTLKTEDCNDKEYGKHQKLYLGDSVVIYFDDENDYNLWLEKHNKPKTHKQLN